MKRNLFIASLTMIAALFILSATPLFAADAKLLRMATTTSTDDTGLLDYLKTYFVKETGIDIQWVATGTGKALKLGENCDADVLLVHAPDAEKKFVAAGFGLDRNVVMYNDFVLIGPASDPAGVKGKGVKECLNTISAKKIKFVSRGDKSGTHQAEQILWKASGLPVPDKETWYAQAGQGMLTTIQMAAEQNGYTLTDRGTYIKYEDTMKGNPPLKILVEGDDLLKNIYSVIVVNPAKCPKVKADLAKAFSDWMSKPSTKNLISDFKLSGKQLFFISGK
ncbi:MAG: tungsten ABC transporter substrate-binding protein [Desulfobacteraceae bacterium]|nr:MAG: tungsten ABC transporter substrate-binding protein [Desulfobacteraceae bacterium]